MEFKVNDKVLFVTDDDFNNTEGHIMYKGPADIYVCHTNKYNKHYSFATHELRYLKEDLFSKLYETLKY